MLPSTRRRFVGERRSMEGTSVNAETVHRWLEGAAASLKENRDYLTQLDAAIGDADHGTNMDRGFTAVVTKLGADNAPHAPGPMLIAAGSTLVSTVGGASGPLWGTALRRAGRAIGSGDEFDGAQLALALRAALDGVVELGAAEEGDKTMVDSLSPAVHALDESLKSGASIAEALATAQAAGEEGMRATVPLLAQKGRASYLGERSIGHQDPGATSTALILAGRSFPTGEGDVVLVARELGASELTELRLGQSQIVGVALAAGAITSHAAIMARALGLPMVVSTGDELLSLAEGEVVVDGGSGRVVVAPDPATRRSATVAIEHRAGRRTALAQMRGLPSVTTDGVPVRLLGNASTAGEVASSLEAGAEGVGLPRARSSRSQPRKRRTRHSVR